MLKKLDRYIIKQYLTTFFFTVMLITLVSVVIDFSERVNKFIDQDIPVKEIVFDYYLNFIPWINGLLWPLFSLISVIFFTSRLAKNTEIVAMLSAGISYRRILVPYLIGASIISSLLWIGNNYVIPRSIVTKDKFENKYISRHKVKSLGADIHLYVNKNEKIYLRYFRKIDTTGQSFRFEKFKDGSLVYALKANKIKMKTLPNEWKLIDYEKRYFDGDKERFELGKGLEFDTILNLTYEDFITNEKDMLTMTTPQLKEVIKREESRGLGTVNRYLIELYRRTSDPFAVIILTLIGVSVSSRKSRGGVGFHLAIGIALGATFVIISKFTETISQNVAFSPLLGSWIPNIFFTLIAIALISRAQK